MPVSVTVVARSGAGSLISNQPIQNQGNLSNVSRKRQNAAERLDGDDQCIPDISSARRSQSKAKSNKRSPPPMQEDKEENRTVEEHVGITAGAAATAAHSTACETVDTLRFCPTAFTHSSQRRNHSNQARAMVAASNAKSWEKALIRTYQRGLRSPELIRLLHTMRGPIPLRVVIMTCEYVYAISERSFHDAAPGPSVKSHHDRVARLCNYTANLLFRLSPSGLILLCAAFYVGKFFRMRGFDQCRSSSGCSFRLLTTALFIAHRYMEFHSQVGSSYYEQWSSITGGLFSAEQLMLMESSMLRELNMDPYIAYQDFEYFVDRVFFTQAGQNVPTMLDVSEILRPVGLGTGEADDSIVPTREIFV